MRKSRIIFMVLTGKPKGGPRRRWEDNIRMDLRVFKKSAPNNKLTLYLASRDLVISEKKIDKLQGVLLVDPDYLQDRKRKRSRNRETLGYILLIVCGENPGAVRPDLFPDGRTLGRCERGLADSPALHKQALLALQTLRAPMSIANNVKSISFRFQVFGQVTLTFRYGREDEEVMGLKFCNEAVMCLAQLYPCHERAVPEPNTPLQKWVFAFGKTQNRFTTSEKQAEMERERLDAPGCKVGEGGMHRPASRCDVTNPKS
uniref:Uncharacterized protein n=1 Tax=Timema bartmani TaxID=61472 RepID=A0A7R9HVP4_9NEOP|nr:unnamed protein product [Timema bartmani]